MLEVDGDSCLSQRFAFLCRYVTGKWGWTRRSRTWSAARTTIFCFCFLVFPCVINKIILFNLLHLSSYYLLCPKLLFRYVRIKDLVLLLPFRPHSGHGGFVLEEEMQVWKCWGLFAETLKGVCLLLSHLPCRPMWKFLYLEYWKPIDLFVYSFWIFLFIFDFQSYFWGWKWLCFVMLKTKVKDVGHLIVIRNLDDNGT